MSFRFEPLSYLLSTGIAELGARSWSEAGNDKDVFEYDPDWARYGKMEKADILRFVAVRDEADQLSGYASIIITDSLHDRKVSCGIIQDIFIAPEKRKYGTANKLMDFVETQLAGCNVMHISIAERLMVGETGKWLARRGYRCNERIWTKPLGIRSIH